MAWQVSGRSLDLCSCKMWCPCWLGPEIEPDEGWCAHTFGFEIQQGSSDGVDLSGTTVAFTGEWPANFLFWVEARLVSTLAKPLPKFNCASWKQFSVARRAVIWRVFGAR